MGVGGVVVESGAAEAEGVEEVDVSGLVGDHDGVFGGDGVEVAAVEEALLGSFGVVELEAADPLAGVSVDGATFEGFLDFADGAEVAVLLGDVADAAAHDVSVGVDEAGEDGFAGCVYYFGGDAVEGGDVFVRADGEEAPVFDGDGGGGRRGGVDGDDVGVVDDSVGVQRHGLFVSCGGFEEDAFSHCASPSRSIARFPVVNWGRNSQISATADVLGLSCYED